MLQFVFEWHQSKFHGQPSWHHISEMFKNTYYCQSYNFRLCKIEKGKFLIYRCAVNLFLALAEAFRCLQPLPGAFSPLTVFYLIRVHCNILSSYCKEFFGGFNPLSGGSINIQTNRLKNWCMATFFEKWPQLIKPLWPQGHKNICSIECPDPGNVSKKFQKYISSRTGVIPVLA